MIINKILNNNVIISVDENNDEIIAMGRGIAFKKKCGEEVLDDQIDKIFTIPSKGISNRFQEILEIIPLEHMSLTSEIINDAKKSLGRKLNDSIYISLADHIYTAVQRHSDGIVIKNPLLWDTKRFYKDEFTIGMKALDYIEERFKVRLSDDEAGFIALHIVNAQLDGSIPVTHDVTKVMNEITSIVKYKFNLNFDEESVYYYRFISHLKFFTQRLFNGKEYKNEDDDGLLDVIKVKYSESYKCVVNIEDFIRDTYSYDLSSEEMLYLTIHIEKIVQESKR